VAGVGDLLDRVVDDLAQRGIEHVLAEVDRWTQAGVLDVVHFGDVGSGVAHGEWVPSVSRRDNIISATDRGRVRPDTPGKALRPTISARR
jgi:hypothetical protein